MTKDEIDAFSALFERLIGESCRSQDDRIAAHRVRLDVLDALHGRKKHHQARKRSEEERSKFIAGRVRALRAGLGITQGQLGERAGFKHQSTVSKIELGRSETSTANLEAVAKALGVDLDALLPTGSGAP